MRATGVSQVDFFSDELIAAQTDFRAAHQRGPAHQDLDSQSGDLLARGKVIAFSYTESGPALSFFARLFK